MMADVSCATSHECPARHHSPQGHVSITMCRTRLDWTGPENP
jgi:hypothetical protein